MHFDSTLGYYYMKLRLYVNKFLPCNVIMVFRGNGVKMHDSMTLVCSITNNSGRALNILDTLLKIFYQRSVDAIKVYLFAPHPTMFTRI